MAERSPRTGTATGATTGTASQTDEISAQAKEGAHRAGDIMRASKDEAIGEAKEMMRDAADRQRRRAAESLGGMAQALHNSARDLEKESSTMARYTDMAAERLDEVAGYLKSADWNEIRHSAESFARRQPYWFIGGAVAAGFLAARFLKSGSTSETSAGMGSTGRGGSTYAPAATTTTPGYGSTTTASPYASSATSPTATTEGSATTTRTGDLT